MNSTNSSGKLPACPPVSEDMVVWLESLYPSITTSMGLDLRDLDYQSGQCDVVAYLRSQLDKQRS